MSSSSSSSSISESTSSASSSSTENVLWYSQVYIPEAKRRLDHIRVVIQVDLALTDVNMLKELAVQPEVIGSGVFGGVEFTAEDFLLGVHTVLTATLPRSTKAVEDAAINAWTEDMLQALRNVLSQVRSDGEDLVLDLHPSVYRIL